VINYRNTKLSIFFFAFTFCLLSTGQWFTFGDKAASGTFDADDMVRPPESLWSIKISPRGYALPVAINGPYVYLSNSFGDLTQYNLETGKWNWTSKTLDHTFGNWSTSGHPAFYQGKAYIGRVTSKCNQPCQPRGLYVLDEKTGRVSDIMFKNQSIGMILRIGSTLYVEVENASMGSIVAVDLDTKQIIWKSPEYSTIISFYFLADRENLYLYAYDAYTGTPPEENRITHVHAFSQTTGKVVWISDAILGQHYRVSVADDYVIVAKNWNYDSGTWGNGLALIDKKSGRIVNSALLHEEQRLGHHVVRGNSLFCEFSDTRLGSFNIATLKFEYLTPFIPRPRLNWLAEFFATKNYLYTFADGLSAYSLATGERVWSTDKILFHDHYFGDYVVAGKYLIIQQADTLKAYYNK